MSKAGIERAIVGVIAGLIAALIVSLFISLIAPLIAGILSVQIAGGNRKRSITIGGGAALLWGIWSALPFLGGVLTSLSIFDILFSVVLGVIGGLIANRFFKNNEAKADTPLSLGGLFKNRIVGIIVVVVVIALIIFAVLYYIGVQRLSALFFKPALISSILGGSWRSTTTPQTYGYTENGKYYNSGVTDDFGYSNTLMVVEIANYSNATSAGLSYTNETPLIGFFGDNSTETYGHNGTSQGFVYSFYNGTYVPLCLLNCNNAGINERDSEIIALENTYVVSILVYNYSMTQSQATQLTGMEFTALSQSTT